MIKVSVIVPIYNSEKYLKKSIDSILNQTLKEIEVIAVLNGCNDNSKDIISSYEDYRLKIFELDTPSIGNARNEGINNSNGNYILFFDADDFMNPNMCEALYDYAISYNLDIVTSDYYTYIETKKKQKYTHTYNFENCNLIKNSELLYKINLGPIKLFKRKLIVDNKIEFPIDLKYEDIPFVASCLKYSTEIGKVPLPLFNYVIHDGSEQNTINNKVFDIIEIMNITNEIFKNDKYLIEDLMNLNAYIFTTYMLKQKYQKDTSSKNRFIDECFAYLNKHFPKWHKSKYMMSQNVLKQYIKGSKKLTKLYCGIVQFWK